MASTVPLVESGHSIFRIFPVKGDSLPENIVDFHMENIGKYHLLRYLFVFFVVFHVEG